MVCRMGRVFEALGMSVGVVTDHIAGPENQAAFDADITYVTATNLGWLYLHDNSNADKAEHLVQFVTVLIALSASQKSVVSHS